MKRIVTVALTFILIVLIPSGIILGQDKKNEQKIKIVVADKSGTTVEIDTIIRCDTPVDSIKMKNGEVIYISKHGSSGTVKHMESGNGDIFVTVSSGDKGEKGEKVMMKHVKVIEGDSAHLHAIGEGDGNVVVVRNSGHNYGVAAGNAISVTTTEGDSKGVKYVYINEDKVSGKNGGKTFDVKVTTDESGNSVEKTKFVIAKDGMVITVEGDNEAKVKEMIKSIESTLGVTRDDKNIKPVVKEETKKTTKK